jgi:hypothetical protein
MSLMFQQNLGLKTPVEEEEEEEEEEPELPNDWTRTEERCVSCNDHLHFTEEAVLLKVMYPSIEAGEEALKDFVVDEGENVGDYYYTPLFFEFACWEELAESLRLMVEDAPPVRHRTELLRCDFCDCSICEDEIMGTAYVGEFHVSNRLPNGEVTTKFDTSANPYHVCIGCLVLLNDQELELWDDELNQGGECQECTHIRCWRYEATCSCPCHVGGDDG